MADQEAVLLLSQMLAKMEAQQQALVALTEVLDRRLGAMKVDVNNRPTVDVGNKPSIHIDDLPVVVKQDTSPWKVEVTGKANVAIVGGVPTVLPLTVNQNISFQSATIAGKVKILEIRGEWLRVTPSQGQQNPIQGIDGEFWLNTLGLLAVKL